MQLVTSTAEPERPKRSHEKVGILRENTAGAAAYLSFVPAVLLLLVEPYKKSYFIRFHAIQCLLCWAAGALLAIVLRLGGGVLFLIPRAGPLLVLILDALVVLAVLLIWVVLVIKAWQGERFEIPLVGRLANTLAPESE